MKPVSYSIQSDIKTILWKEMKSWMRYQGSRSRTIMTLISPLIIAIYFPISMESEWTQTYWPLVMAFLVPTMIAGLTVPDSFAGEKERNTLPTLLASRLPDRAILFGKMIFGIATSWIAGLIMLVVALVVVNIAASEGQLLFYAPKVLIAFLGISLLMATVTTSAGVLISMRSSTAQEASQLLISILLMPPMLLGVGATTLLMGNGDFIESLDGDLILLIVAGVLLVGSIGLTLAAMRRFRRARLVFD